MTEQGLAGDILEEKYRNPDSITDNELFLYFIANMDRDDVYHGGQKRGFNMGAVWSPEEVLADPHLQDRGFWAEVDYPRWERSCGIPGRLASSTARPGVSPGERRWVGEHNEEVLCGELGLTRAELAVLAEGGVV